MKTWIVVIDETNTLVAVFISRHDADKYVNDFSIREEPASVRKFEITQENLIELAMR